MRGFSLLGEAAFLAGRLPAPTPSHFVFNLFNYDNDDDGVDEVNEV